MNKFAIVTVLVCLVVVPTFAFRLRSWDSNSKCRGGPSSELVYSNKKDLCQPYQQGGSSWMKVLSDCKNGKSVSYQLYDDGTCTTPTGSVRDSIVVNNGDCIGYTVVSQSSYIADCNSGSALAPGLVAILVFAAMLFF